MIGFETMKALVTGAVPPPPIASLIGINFTDVERGEATMSLEVGTRHRNPMGTLHGGILCDLGDAAMGCAVATTLEEAQSFTTLELKLNFFKPVREGQLVARGRVVRRTRRIAYAEAEVIDSDEHLVAKLNCTCLILEGRDAEER